ncbi:MAG: RNA polymerase sigma factor [Bacteroidales bacterium]
MEDKYICEILNGNTSGYSYFVSNYKDMAYSIAYRIVNNKEDAEEIVQDSFVRAYKSLHKFRQSSKFSTWFYRIVVNRALSIRSQVKKFIIEIDLNTIPEVQFEEIDTAYRNLTQVERVKYINSALKELPEEDSLLLTLFYLNENSIAEITEITGISGENVKMKLSRARKKMYVKLEKSLKLELKSIL